MIRDPLVRPAALPPIGFPSPLHPCAGLLFAAVVAGAITPPYFTAAQSGAATLVAIAAAGLWARQFYRRSQTPIDLPLKLFLGWAACSAVFGVVRGNDLNYVAGDVVQIVEFVSFFYVATMVMRSRGDVNAYLALTLLILGVQSFWQIWSWYMGSVLYTVSLEGVDLARAGSFVGAMTIPILAMLMIAQWRFISFGGTLVLIATAVTTILSFTRSMWVAGLASLLVIFVAIRWKYRMLLCLLLLIAGLSSSVLMELREPGLDLWEAISSRALYTLDQAAGSTLQTERLIELQGAWDALTRNPIMGVGLGGTYAAFGALPGTYGSDYLSHGAFAEDKHYIHNTAAQVALRMGLVGLVLFIWFLVTYFIRAVGLYRSKRDTRIRCLLLGCISSVAGTILMSLTAPVVFAHPQASVMGMIVGITFAASSAYQERLPAKSRLAIAEPAAAPRRNPAPSAPSPQTLERLRSLGYVE